MTHEQTDARRGASSDERVLARPMHRLIGMAYETTHQANEKTIDQLNSLLRGELSACETYRQALEKLTDSPFRAQLEDCFRSHESRVSQLKSRVISLGGQASEGSGAWGAFAKLVEGGAKLFGDKAAIAALEEGEDHGVKDYKDALEKLDIGERAFVETCLREQERTHSIVSGLKHSFH